jgi:hypothetical protein
MKIARGVLPLAAMLVIASRLSAQTIPPPRLNNEQRKRAQVLSKLVDEVFAQKHSAPADVALTFQGSFIGAENGLVYIPYTVNIDGKFDTSPVVMYVRVLEKDAKPADYDASKTTTMRGYLGQMSVVNDTKDIRNGYVDATGVVAEDIQFFEPPKDGRLMRGMWLAPGEYTLFVAMQEKGVKALPKTVVFRQSLVVPDLSKSLSVSSLILADRIEPAPATTKNRNQLDEPYDIAGTRITPSATSRLRRSGDLTVVYYVYHPALGADSKPRLQSDYTFYSSNAGVEQVFTRSAPQVFDAQTLPPDFNPAVHQIMGGQAIALSSFPIGDYRLEVKVTDQVNNTSTIGSTTFSVFGQ